MRWLTLKGHTWFLGFSRREHVWNEQTDFNQFQLRIMRMRWSSQASVLVAWIGLQQVRHRCSMLSSLVSFAGRSATCSERLRPFQCTSSSSLWGESRSCLLKLNIFQFCSIRINMSLTCNMGPTLAHASLGKSGLGVSRKLGPQVWGSGYYGPCRAT